MGVLHVALILFEFNSTATEQTITQKINIKKHKPQNLVIRYKHLKWKQLIITHCVQNKRPYENPIIIKILFRTIFPRPSSREVVKSLEKEFSTFYSFCAMIPGAMRSMVRYWSPAHWLWTPALVYCVFKPKNLWVEFVSLSYEQKPNKVLIYLC